jgi:hypothetical protein
MEGRTTRRYPDHTGIVTCPEDLLCIAGIRRKGPGWTHEWELWHDEATLEWVVEFRLPERNV